MNIKQNYKKILKEIVIGAALLFIFTNIISYIRKPELSSTHLPQLKVQLLNGDNYSPKKGKPLVVHFWATWCPTCKLEASNIEAVSEEYEVLTIAVNSGDNIKIKTYMNERDLSFKVLNDSEGEWARLFNVEAYPTTFIYDASGELKFTEVGYTSTVGLLGRLKLIE
jgi:thiol-disulfide isomerase/thioredoxin